MTTLLLTGGTGQVGRALQRLAPPGIEIIAPGRDVLNLRDPASVEAVVVSRAWTAVINAGGYTAVDRAESDVVAAWQANAVGPAALAAATAAMGIPLLHLSTDYVFNGAKPGVYVEEDAVAPLGVYGASKEAGEQAVRTANPRHLVLRTAWIVSADGSNFVKTMLRLGAEYSKLRVVADQHGCPTAAADIARTLFAVLDKIGASETPPWGTYHFVNAGETTWHALAEAIFTRAAEHGMATPVVTPIATRDYPTPARRPPNSRLATGKLSRTFGIYPRSWQEAIAEVVDRLFETELTS